MKNLKEKKIILWDFDGVIMDSMPIRNNGFELVLKEFPTKEVDLLMEFHQKNGGLSRYVKFRYFFENIRKEELSDEKLRQWAEKFSVVMKKELLAPELLIEDSLDFIKKNYQKYMMHIVSGSDQEELRFICKQLNISDHFISIHGSPTPKIELVRILLKEHNYNPMDVVLIGDSFNDYEAAEKNNIEFYGYNNHQLKKLSSSYVEMFSKI